MRKALKDYSDLSEFYGFVPPEERAIASEESVATPAAEADSPQVVAAEGPEAEPVDAQVTRANPQEAFAMAASIAFTGYNADGNDNLAFVALDAIASGSVIYFTDNEWNSAGTGFVDFNESTFSLTLTSAIAAGTIVTIDNVSTAGATSSNFGTVAAVAGGGTNRGFAAGGDTVYAYVADAASPLAPTTFLAAVTTNTGGYTTAASGFLTNTGLAVGTSALDLSTVDAGADIGAFNGARNSEASFAAYASIINTAANWVTQDTSADDSVDGTNPDLPFSPTAFTLAAAGENQTITLSPATLSQSEGNAGPTAYTFTVTRTGGTSGQLDFTLGFAAGTTNAADFAGGVLPSGLTGSILAGQASATVTIDVAGDTLLENDEQFRVTLTGGTNPSATSVTVGAANIATATIVNDEGNATTLIGAALPSLAGNTVTPVTTGDVQLVRVGSIVGTAGEGGAESVAYDAATDRLFVTNAASDRIDVLQLGADGTPGAAGTITLGTLPGYGEVNSVAVKNGILAVAIQNAVGTEPGIVQLYDSSTLALITTVTVGVLPDMITFSPDGTRILVANEGEALSATSNPGGSVSIIDVPAGGTGASVIGTVVFSGLSVAALQAAGLSIVTAQGTNDIEPEYITVSPDGTRAYVTLQEVNAVAVIDLTNPSSSAPIAIQALGGVDHNLAGNAFDPSDRDGAGGTAAIGLVNENVIGLLQPDAISSFQVGGVTYFITANEGDARVPDGVFGDVVRVNSAGYTLDGGVYTNAAALEADGRLGRLNVLTTVGNTDGDAEYEQVYTIGGRSFSIFRVEANGSVTKVRESGGEFEAIIARDYPSVFNTNQNQSSLDTRSDDKGPEPEGVTTGVINGRTYAFIALERVGGIMVYDVTDPATANFVYYIPATANDNGPETITFISAADSPSGVPLVVTANEISGTTTVYRVALSTAGNDTVTGSAFNDNLTGGAGDDVFRLEQGGTDTASGGAGNDGFYFGAAYTGADSVNGGAGTLDQIGLQGNYAAGVTLGTLADTELVVLLTGADTRFGEGGTNRYDYVLTSADASVAAGRQLVVQGNLLAPGEDLTFNGAAETDGSFLIYGGFGIETLTGGAGNDGFFFGNGRYAAGDVVNGGAGTMDQLGFQGNFSIDYTAPGYAGAITGIEFFVLLSASDNRFGAGGGSVGYTLIMADANVAAGQRLVVQANTLRAGETLDFRGFIETNGNFSIFSGAGDDRLSGGQSSGDVIVGGAGNDVIEGQGGGDQLTGGAGADTFAYLQASHSTNASRDQVLDFTLGDLIDLTGLVANTGGTPFTFIGGNAQTGSRQLQVIQSGNASTVNVFVDADTVADLVIDVTVADAHTLTVADFRGATAQSAGARPAEAPDREPVIGIEAPQPVDFDPIGMAGPWSAGSEQLGSTFQVIA